MLFPPKRKSWLYAVIMAFCALVLALYEISHEARQRGVDRLLGSL